MEIKVYQDGKVCRAVNGAVTGKRAGGIQVQFPIDSWDKGEWVERRWFRRRSRKGKYECIGWNYWILPKDPSTTKQSD